MSRKLHHRRLLIGIVAAFAAAAFGADMKVPRRRHFVVTTGTGHAAYTVTQTRFFSEERDEETFLIADDEGDRFVLSYESNYKAGRITYTMTHFRSGAYIKVSYPQPAPGRTRSEVIAEGKKSRKALDVNDRLVTITTSGGANIVALESEWKQPELAAHRRAEVRETLSPRFLEALELMDSTGLIDADGPMSSFRHGLLTYVLHRPECASSAASRIIQKDPDCGFDKRFGKPCSDAQEALVSNSRQSPASNADRWY